jgi:hypothetical protein
MFENTVSFDGNTYHTLDDGTILHVQTDPGVYIHVSVYPPTDPPAQCWAEIYNNKLTIAAFTRDTLGNPLTDYLYAKEFFDYSISYFGINNIECLSAVINTMSSVRTEIIEEFERTRDLQYAAEVCTFSRLAAIYGFDDVRLKVYPPENLEVGPWGNMELNIFKSD